MIVCIWFNNFIIVTCLFVAKWIVIHLQFRILNLVLVTWLNVSRIKLLVLKAQRICLIVLWNHKRHRRRSLHSPIKAVMRYFDLILMQNNFTLIILKYFGVVDVGRYLISNGPTVFIMIDGWSLPNCSLENTIV